MDAYRDMEFNSIEKQYFFLSGLPRTGSTLLSTILGQNPNLHAPGNSPLCQMMWDAHISITVNAAQQIDANRKSHVAEAMVKFMPDLYYAESKKQYVIDKCRSWTLAPNIELIKQYITKQPKIVVLIRPIDEIVKSFVALRKANGVEQDAFNDLLTPKSEPIMRSLDGVINAKQDKNTDFLFVSYADLVERPKHTIESVYAFFGVEKFEHNFSAIEQTDKEDDVVYGLLGQHDVRSEIAYAPKNIELPTAIQKKCDELNALLFG